MINDIKPAVKNRSDAECEHNVSVCNRDRITVTGVNDVSEFSDNIIRLKTCMGDMTIKGHGLSIIGLDVGKGELEANGGVDVICYSAAKKGGFWSGLLK